MSNDTVVDCGVADARSKHVQRLLALAVRAIEDEICPALDEGRPRTSATMVGAVLRFVIKEMDELGRPAPFVPCALAGDDGRLTQEALEAVTREGATIRERSAAEAGWPLPRRSEDAEKALVIDEERLAAYLLSSGVGQDTIKVTNLVQLLGGLSKETYIFDALIDGAPQRLVLRRDALDSPVETNVAHEYHVIEKLAAAGLEVPAPVLLEKGSAVFGQPFMLTAWRPGKSVPHMQGLAMGSDQAQAARELAGFLGRLHAIEPAAIGLDLSRPGLATTRDYLRDAIEAAEASWHRRSTPDSASIRTAFKWLKSNIPESVAATPRIAHGDAGLHNILVDSGRISAMLDWELVHLGDPGEDLAYCRTWIDQVLPWDAFLDIYYSSGGPEYKDENETFYGLLSEVKVAVMSNNCISIVNESAHPELGWAFGRIHYYPYFAGKIADRLLKISAERC